MVALVLAVAGCAANSGPTDPSPISSIRPPVTPAAMAMCDAALHARTLTAQSTTLGEARRTNIGGPSPGLRPAEHVFPDEPAAEAAAWCWAATSHPSPGYTGSSWTLYVAVPGGRAADVFSMGGGTTPPTGPPSIP